MVKVLGSFYKRKLLLSLLIVFSVLLSPSFADSKKNSIELTLLDWGEAFSELAGTEKIYYEKDLSGCYVNGGDWVVKDIRNGSGEYCISHETLETFQIKKGKAVVEHEPSTPKLMERFQWLSWLYSNWAHRYPTPTAYIGKVDVIEALYAKEKEHLKNDPHLAVYWLLHFKILLDSRYDTLKEELRPHTSSWVQAAISYLDNLPLDKNYNLAKKNPLLFKQRRAYAIYSVTYQDENAIDRLWQSYLLDDSYLGSAQAFRLVELSKRKQSLPSLLQKLEKLEKHKQAQDYILLQSESLSKDERLAANVRLLKDLKENYKTWKNYSTPKKILAVIAGDAPVGLTNDLIDLYYSDDKYSADYLLLKKQLAKREGKDLSRFNLDIAKLDLIVDKYRLTLDKGELIAAFDGLNDNEKKVIIDKLPASSRVLIPHIWEKKDKANAVLLKLLIEKVNDVNNKDLATIFDSNGVEKIQWHQGVLLDLLAKKIEGKESKHENYKGMLAKTLKHRIHDPIVSKALLDILVDKNVNAVTKKEIFAQVFGLYSMEFYIHDNSFGNKLSLLLNTQLNSKVLDYFATNHSSLEDNKRLIYKAFINQPDVYPLSMDDKDKLTQIFSTLLKNKKIPEYDRDTVLVALFALNTKNSSNAFFELLYKYGYWDEDKFDVYSEEVRLASLKQLSKSQSMDHAFLHHEMLDNSSSFYLYELMQLVVSWQLVPSDMSYKQLIKYHNILSSGIKFGLGHSQWERLPEAYQQIKMVEVQLKKYLSVEKFSEGWYFDDFDAVGDPIESQYGDENLSFKRLSNGKLASFIQAAKQKATIKLADLNHHEIRLATNRTITTKLWQSKSAILFADYDNRLHYLQSKGLGSLPFTVISVLKKGKQLLKKNEKRRDTKLWFSKESNNIIEWVNLGSKRILLIATNLDMSKDVEQEDLDLEEYDLSSIEGYPINSKYISGIEFEGNASLAVLLDFDAVKKAEQFFKQLENHIPPRYKTQDPWFLPNLGELKREYITKTNEKSESLPKIPHSYLYTPERSSPDLGHFVETEHHLINSGLEYYKYDIDNRGLNRFEDLLLSNISFYFMNDTSASKNEGINQWIEVLKEAKKQIHRDDISSHYPELKKFQIDVGEASPQSDIDKLQEKLNVEKLPSTLLSLWKHSSPHILIKNNNNVELEILSPKQIIEKSHPLQDLLSDVVKAKKGNEKKILKKLYHDSVLVALSRDKAFYYLPKAKKINMINRENIFGYNKMLDENLFSPEYFSINTPKIFSVTKLNRSFDSDLQATYLYGDKNELEETRYVLLLVDYQAHTLMIDTNIESLDHTNLTEYPSKDTLNKDVKTLISNFKKLGMHLGTKKVLH